MLSEFIEENAPNFVHRGNGIKTGIVYGTIPHTNTHRNV